MMLKSCELPDCVYSNRPELIRPGLPTPNHTLYLSNLDDQNFLRFSIKYLYLFSKSINIETLKCSLSRVLVEYYPLAGRLKASREDDQKLQVDCNGEGAVFAEAFMDLSVEEFLLVSNKPNKSWRKLLYKVEAPGFLDIPPLVIQVTSLRRGGMILCTAINHCLCDGIGTSQFLHAWAHMTTKPATNLPVRPIHCRHLLKPRNPPQVPFSCPGFTKIATNKFNSKLDTDVYQYLQSQPLAPASITFTPSQILHLKRHCLPSLKCTSFEVLASHTWRCWVKSLELPPSLKVKLLFSCNVRKILKPNLQSGYYGNGFVLACADAIVKELDMTNLYNGVKLVQSAKSAVTHDYVKCIIDLLEDKNVKTNLSTSLVISQWSKLGLGELDFGEGKPLHMGPLTSDIYCLFLPLIGEFDGVRVLVSMPENIVDKFEYYMTNYPESVGVEDSNKKKCGVDKPTMVTA